MADSAHKHTNRLIRETSPYLLQHAHNPVDWHPWGEEALALARAEDKPVFLSIGYSACHWCHVMERESFENERIAETMNRLFVCIKVDREERPDIDDLYMQSVQMLTGRGGWPMSVWLTPDLKPYFGGTYFPPEDGPRGMGFRTVCERLAEAYRMEREKVIEGAAEIADAMRQTADFVREGAAGDLGPDILEGAARSLAHEFDAAYGGFGGAPKFPPSMALNFLLREYARAGDLSHLAMAEKTLQKMSDGGIFDQLGGGFHRYSTDHVWLAPHFEKMLYDNALMTIPLIDAHLVTGNAAFLSRARETLDYVLRDMTSPEGGFYSTEDADSEGEEGKFYLWTPGEVVSLLGVELGHLVCEFYDVTPQGNFEGKNILRVITPLEEFARRRGADPAELAVQLAAARAKMFEERRRRIAPGKDDKVVTAWNGMMISAFARGAQATGDERYAAAAARSADFVLSALSAADGGLLRTWRAGGQAKISGFIDDYALFASGLVDLYETTFDPRWLGEAARLAEIMMERFADRAGGGFYTSDGRDPSLIVRRKEFHDGATPSGNSAAVWLLLRLALLLDRPEWREFAMTTMKAMAPILRRAPGAVHHLLCAAGFALGAPKEIAIVGDPAAPETRALLAAARRRFLGSRVIACAAPGALAKGFNAKIALLQGKTEIGGKPAAYVCQNYACGRPAMTPEELAAALA